MKIALIGYGKMGRAVEQVVLRRGHQIVLAADNESALMASTEALKTADVAIEFTTPSTAVANIMHCLEVGTPVVCGTTGWYDAYDEVCKVCQQRGGALFTATNFSLGMNIMFALNEQLSRLMKCREEYSVSIEEIHHIHKLDAPSGTALTLAKQIERERGEEVPISSVREGEVPGTHKVVYSSPIDTLTLIHEAHSREGLAVGAVVAAEFLSQRKGIYTMKDLLG